MVALHLGAWTALGLRWSGADGGLAGLTALDWTLIVILVGCAQTVALTLARTIRVLGDERRPT